MSGGGEGTSRLRRGYEATVGRLTAQALKFRVALSALSCENVPSHAKRLQVAWKKTHGKAGHTKTLAATKSAQADQEGKASFPDELTQVVTMYYQLADGDLQVASKEYAFKLRNPLTRATVAKGRLDLSQYCSLDENFSRSWVEVAMTNGAKLFMLICTELVNVEPGDLVSPNEPSTSTLDLSLPSGDKDGDVSPECPSPCHTSARSANPFEAAAGARVHDRGVSVDSDLIKESISVLHSSSSECSDSESGQGWKKTWKNIKRKLTPGQSIARRHTVALSGEELNGTRKNLFETAADSSVGEPATVAAVAAAAAAAAAADSRPASDGRGELEARLKKLGMENDLIKLQCDHLRGENQILKSKLTDLSARGSGASTPPPEGKGRKSGLRGRGGKGAEASPPSGSPLTPLKSAQDILEELITTKLKLAQARSTIDELTARLQADKGGGRGRG